VTRGGVGRVGGREELETRRAPGNDRLADFDVNICDVFYKKPPAIGGHDEAIIAIAGITLI
jgi:hypothetical protein